MKRRQFITLLGGAAAAPVLVAHVARAQPQLPVVGFLNTTSAEERADNIRAVRAGLKEMGYVEGENILFEHRDAESQLDRLPVLAAELVRRKVAAIVTGTEPAILAALAATKTIPIVFNIGDDPVKRGLVASLARPEANVTGVNFMVLEVVGKRLELLRQLVPNAARVAVLVNPAQAGITETTLQQLEPAARSMGLQIQVHNAGTAREIDAAFATIGRERPDVLFVSTGPFFTSRRLQLVQWATRIGIPAAFGSRPYAEIGGLMSYGTSGRDAYRQIGIYVGRILKGAKPGDLPVVQSSKFELVINAQTARMLGITVSPSLLSIADEVIE